MVAIKLTGSFIATEKKYKRKRKKRINGEAFIFRGISRDGKWAWRGGGQRKAGLLLKEKESI